MPDLCIKSDFTDFYDVLGQENSTLIYNRYIKECKQRGTDLKYLRSLGIKTLEIKQVNQFFSGDGKIVVYTNPKGHNGNGKKVMTVDEALLSHSNCIASKFYENTDRLTIKFVQIGKRRFTLCFYNDTDNPLHIGQLINIKESESFYNRIIGLPIFSIDYISVNGEMIATDFNEVQNLSEICMQRYISKTEVLCEITEALAIYNKY